MSAQPSSSLHTLILGASAVGASVAARLRRRNESAPITLIDRQSHISTAACGFPYAIGREIADAARLSLHSPESLAHLLHITIRSRTEAVRIDRARKRLIVRPASGGPEEQLDYHKLVLAPGAAPLVPPLPGLPHPRIRTLRTLDDLHRIAALAESSTECAVLGAGFIGLEMAEQLARLGKSVTLIELASQILPPLDHELAALVQDELDRHAIQVILGDGVASFESSNADRVTAVLQSGRRISAELIILAIGVRPDTTLARESGLALAASGAILVNEHLQSSDPDIYAGGDAIESRDRILGKPLSLPLGGPANRQGRLIADHIADPATARPYPGHLGTAIVRIFDLTAGLVGWTEQRLKREGVPYQTATVTGPQHASYFPGSVPLTVKILWEPVDGRLLGGQVVGADGVDKRIDVLAAALVGRLTIHDLAELELAYAPPFGNSRDVLNTAGFTAQNIRDGWLIAQSSLSDVSRPALLDVRPRAVAEIKPIRNAIHIPLDELRANLGSMDPSRPLLAVCELGKSSYFAARILAQSGFQARSLAGGLRIHGRHLLVPTPRLPDATPPAPSHRNDAPTGTWPTLDLCGISCPGPLLKIREAVTALAPGAGLEALATDPGFARDMEAFAKQSGLTLAGINRRERGITAVRLMRPLTTAAPAPTVAAAHRDTTLIVFSQELDKALAAFVVANGGAAMGGRVTMFFTFWGLNILRKHPAPACRDKGWLDHLFGWMLPCGPQALPLSRMHFAGAGTALMKWRMNRKNLPSLPGLLASARAASVRLVACSMSMEAMGLRIDDLLDGVEVGGVADMLAASQSSSATLFI